MFTLKLGSRKFRLGRGPVAATLNDVLKHRIATAEERYEQAARDRETQLDQEIELHDRALQAVQVQYEENVDAAYQRHDDDVVELLVKHVDEVLTGKVGK